MSVLFLPSWISPPPPFFWSHKRLFILCQYNSLVRNPPIPARGKPDPPIGFTHIKQSHWSQQLQSPFMSAWEMYSPKGSKIRKKFIGYFHYFRKSPGNLSGTSFIGDRNIQGLSLGLELSQSSVYPVTSCFQCILLVVIDGWLSNIFFFMIHFHNVRVKEKNSINRSLVMKN